MDNKIFEPVYGTGAVITDKGLELGSLSKLWPKT